MDDVGDTFATALALSDSEITEFIGTLDLRDQDVFSINLAAGQTIEVLLDLVDPRATLASGGLTIQAQSDGSLSDVEAEFFQPFPIRPSDGQPQLVFTAPVDDLYFITVLDPSLESPGTYVLKVDPFTPITDPQGDNSRLAAPIAIGETGLAQLHKIDDDDYFELELIEGQHIRLTAEGIGGDPLERFLMELFGPAAVANDSAGPGGNKAVIELTVPETGTYSVAILNQARSESDFWTVVPDAGAYSLRVEELPQPAAYNVSISDAVITRLP